MIDLNRSQVIILIILAIAVILAIWNLVLSIQRIKIEEYRKKEERKDYYGRFK